MAKVGPYDFDARYTDVSVGFATEAARTLRASLVRIEHCTNQLTDDQVWWRPRPEMNAIGNLMLHLCGNIEQWGLAPIEGRPTTRNRPAEFALCDPIPKAELQQRLAASVEAMAGAVESLITPAQLLHHCEIAGAVRPYQTDLLAVIFHVAAHFEGHTQEIIFITRQLLGEKYQFLWVPKKGQQSK
jgi:hypothetical protein